MKRTDIRAAIKEYLTDNIVTELSEEVADELAKYLKGRFPDKECGNLYNVECDFWGFFAENGSISGKIERCDPIEIDHVIDSVSFSIDKDLRVMAWDRDKTILSLDMHNLSEDDESDIMGMADPRRYVDIYRTFMRVPSKDRGKLSSMIPNSMALSLFEDDIPPYAFYQYDGYFLHKTNRGVGDLGGGVGYGGIIQEEGTIAEIGNRFVSIGEHAFDGCKNLTEVHISGNVHVVGKHAFSNIPGLVIYCSASAKPSTWDDDWCDENCKAFFNGQ